jgi:mono/diheme cytochrome c family protein
MSKHTLTFVLAGVMSAAFVSVAQQPVPTVKNVTIRPTSPADGHQMFTSYCAVCHGANGKGAGPAAQAMKIPPADLTLLSKKNSGVFPANHVASVLEFGIENPAHGSAQMPIWGDLMRSLSPVAQDPGTLVHQRINNITDYLKQIQQ